MTGPEHYAEGNRLMAEYAARVAAEKPYAPGLLLQAQVHYTAALAAATAMSHWGGADLPMPQPDRLAWERAASERPAAQARQRAADAAETAEFSTKEGA